MEKYNDDFDEDEVFDESSVLAHFANCTFRDTSGNKSTENALDVSTLCCDEEIKGFDKVKGKTWIYPTNYPIRDYQYNIIKTALLKNTLVSLPTGLGKTFIAAVVMYNFYCWYPTGKIIFMAPTRPLVAQQIEACYNIIAIPRNDTVEMTGHMHVNTRKTHWQNKRVFFATPQVIYNDIKSGICQGDRIRCLVIDEAHRARGNYAYCQIFSTLTEMGHRIFRVLALSATPGSKVEDVIHVVKSLNIAHLELRNENCIDVSSYSHSRKINTVVIPLGSELTQLKQQYIEILDGYARRLKQFNILPQNLGNLTKGRVVMLYKEFQTKERGARHPQHNYIMKDFTLLIALFHGFELLVKHGSRVFLNFFDEHPEKSWIQADDKLTALLERLRDDLGVDPLLLDRSVLPDGTIPDIPQNIVFGHPKFYKLKEIMLDHFNAAKQKGQETKAIVFCEYRESVNLVHCLLLQCRPLIVPLMFVGQGASGKAGKATVSQKQQLRVMRAFRGGLANALVCTCVAEEGLDVGAVDLILCFDVASRSPVRLVQRCGRTGRERGGQVFILVTEGKEHQTLIECMRQRDGLNQKILQSKEVENSLYKLNPRMLPRGWTPECQKMYITIEKSKNKEDSEQSRKGQTDLRNMLIRKESKGTASNQNEWITKHEFDKLYPNGYKDCNFFVQPTAYWSMSKESIREPIEMDNSHLDLSTWIELQRNLQETINIGHSEDTEILVDVLKKCEGNNFDTLASTQTPNFATHGSQLQNVFISPMKTTSKQTKKKKIKLPLIKSPCKKYGDIRTLFSTTTKSTKNYTKLINDLGINNISNIPTRIINLLVDLCLEKTNVTKDCYICLNVCNCKYIQNMRGTENLPLSIPVDKEPYLPNINLIDGINIDSLLNYTSKTNNNDEKNDLNSDADKVNIDAESCSGNDTINNFNLDISYNSSCELDSQGSTEGTQENKLNNENNNFDIGDLDDIFAESSPEMVSQIDNVENKSKETCKYFLVDSIEDIFADSDDEVPKSEAENKLHTLNNVSPLTSNILVPPDEDIHERTNKETSIRPPSPSILSGGIIRNNGKSTSPILCSQMRTLITSRAIFNHLQSSTPLNNTKVPENIKRTQTTFTERDLINSSDKSMFTITELLDRINKTDNENLFRLSKSEIGDEGRNENVRNGTSSPIIFTQRDIKIKMENETEKQKVTTTQSPQIEIVVSDSDEDGTQEYDVDAETKQYATKAFKRKFDDEEDNIASPYFNKKQKINEAGDLQKKIRAALSSYKFNNDSFGNKNTHVNFMLLSPRKSPILMAHQENEDPLLINSEKCNTEKLQSKLDKLQMYRHDAKYSPTNKVLSDCTNTSDLLHRRKITFSDSDDDFVSDVKPRRKLKSNGGVHNGFTNHKIRKKKKPSEFLDLEAEISDDDIGSDDESTNESVGSIIDFICDDNVTHDEEDIQAVYLRSVKSPVTGVFKIPKLKNEYIKADVLSQYGVENDTYEKDSFCVDSHVGLTQINEVSELDLAEMMLEEKRRNKKCSKNTPKSDVMNDESPVVKRKFKNVVRQIISSDSEDSS